MYIGRKGLFILRPPFSKLAKKGLRGTIVETVFIQTSVKDGTDVQSSVYLPVGYVGGYANDFKANVIIITIESDGIEYRIPDKYILNLNDDSLTFGYTYCTIKLGLLPKDFDFSGVAATMVDAVEETTGIEVHEDEVSFSFAPNGATMRSSAEALLAKAKRTTSMAKSKSKSANIKDLRDKLQASEGKRNKLMEGYHKLMNHKHP